MPLDDVTDTTLRRDIWWKLVFYVKTACKSNVLLRSYARSEILLTQMGFTRSVQAVKSSSRRVLIKQTKPKLKVTFTPDTKTDKNFSHEKCFANFHAWILLSCGSNVVMVVVVGCVFDIKT